MQMQCHDVNKLVTIRKFPEIKLYDWLIETLLETYKYEMLP